MRWKSAPLVAFDVETTGLYPFDGDRIIEFAAVVFQIQSSGHPGPDVQTHSWIVNPGIPIPPKVTEITGISDQDVAGKPPFEAIAAKVHDLLSNSIAIAHNFSFDHAFLKKELAQVGLHWPDPLAEVDTLDLSMRLYAGSRGHKLADLCKRLDVPLNTAHRATHDAEACGRCFVELTRKHQVSDDLQALLDWAGAIGRPPEQSAIGLGASGQIVFLEGDHKGDPIANHPLTLAWMTKARQHTANGWDWRYPSSLRRWAQRWLDARGSGRMSTASKSFRADDWMLSSCLAAHPSS